MQVVPSFPSELFCHLFIAASPTSSSSLISNALQVCAVSALMLILKPHKEGQETHERSRHLPWVRGQP